MSLEQLKIIIPPSPDVVAIGNSEAWEALEATLNFIFPGDYKQFINAYGAGSFADAIYIYSPFEGKEYDDWVKTELEYYKVTRGMKPEYYQFTIYPEEGGLYPWAMTDGGEKIYWETVGVPDEWSIIGYSARGPEYESWNLSISDFLYLWLSEALISRQLPTKGLKKSFRPKEP